MKEKLLASLKTKYKNLGFGDKAFDGVADYLSKTVTKEEDVETAISGVEPLLKSFQGDIDKVRNEKTELQKKMDALEKKKPTGKDDPPANPPADPEEPGWFKAYREKQDAEATALKQKIEGFEAKEKQASLYGKVKTMLSEKKVPESYWSKRNLNLESEEQIEPLISEIESDYTAFKQEMVNQGVMVDVPPTPEGAKEGADLGKNIAEKRNTQTSDGVKGKEI